MSDAPSPADRSRHWSRIGLVLVAATLAYNVIEAVVALWSGAVAESTALLGFGFDSVIESVAAAALLWRLRVEARGASHERVERAERLVHKLVGGTFFLLAIYVLVAAARALLGQETPEVSPVGIALAITSAVLMPVIAWAKFRVARELQSAALRAEAKETLACAYLSFALLFGLTTYAAFDWGWADPVAALLMVPWLLREGWECLAGEHGHA